MSRPASAAWYRCHTSVFSLSGSDENPSAYNWATAASATRSSRYWRSAGDVTGAGVGAGVAGPGREQAPARHSMAAPKAAEMAELRGIRFSRRASLDRARSAKVSARHAGAKSALWHDPRHGH